MTTAAQKKAGEVEPEPTTTNEPKPKRVRKPETEVKAKKAPGYTPEEDTLLLALVAEHGRAEGLRQFVEQNGSRTKYSAECRLHRLIKRTTA